MAALFFAEMRFDPKDPQNPDSDRFVLSKGHAAPILYAAWAEAGAFDRAELLKLRADRTRISKAIRRRGCRSSTSPPARSARASAPRSAPRSTRAASSPDYRTYVLLGDGESAGRLGLGSGRRRARWTSSTTCAASPTSTRSARAARRCGSTTWGSSSAAGRAFGWHAIVIDGHDLGAILDALAEARRPRASRR